MMTAPPAPGLDALLPSEMAKRAEEIGVKKASMDRVTLLALAVLAGAFIALGAVFATVALALFVAAFDSAFVVATGLDAQRQVLSRSAFFGRNLLPVTIGNLIGGALLVGGVYWFVYLRARTS
jgi:formate/nitrite transporter FocA (FNT family)